MILHKLPPFQNVGIAQTAVMPFVHSGMTIVGIVFKRTGGTSFTATDMTNIRCRLDGKPFIDVAGIDLEDICKYEKYGTAATFSYLPFGDLRAMTQRGQMLGAIDTSIQGMKPMEMEVDIGAAVGALTLEAWAILAPPKAATDPNKATIRALLKSTHTPSAAAENELVLPTGSREGGLIHRVYMFHANVTKLQVAKDGLWLQQEGLEAVLDFMQALGNRANVTGLITFDPTFTDAQTDSISTLRPNGSPATFSWKATTSAGDTIVSYTSMYIAIQAV